jgi:APA family basic amino acid/polyamine antiporter
MSTVTFENGLKRTLGLLPLTNIVIANMIGTGIFTMSGLLMTDLNHPLLLVGLWLVGGVIALCGALCYSELGTAYPHAGGEYIFLSKLYHPLLGFLSGWVSFIVGFSAPIAAASIGFSEYFTAAFPQLIDWGTAIGISDPVWIKKGLSVMVILSFTLIHLRGIEFGAVIQNFLTLLKIIMICGLIVVGFSIGKGNMAHLVQADAFNFNFGNWKTIGLSVMWIMFAYSGWNASTYIGSEIKNPAKTLPRSLIMGTGIVMLLYILLNTLYVYAVPPDSMKGVISIGGLAVGFLFGSAWGKVFSLFIAIALFSSISAYIILGPRIYFAMAKDGYFFRFVSKINPRSNVPAKSIMLQCLLSIVLVMSGTFDQILTYMGFSLGIFPILCVIGVFKLRKMGTSTFRMPGYPVVPMVYILAGISILCLAYMVRPVECSIALATALAGIPAFFLFKKYSGAHPGSTEMKQ